MHKQPKHPKYQQCRDHILGEYQALNGRPTDYRYLHDGDKGSFTYRIKRIILELAEITRAMTDNDIDREVIIEQVSTISNFIGNFESEGMSAEEVKEAMEYINHVEFGLPTKLDRLRARVDKEEKAFQKKKAKAKAKAKS
tara:strand:- start:727 stop:1146 length:420 start_codon:yes stop_codon:yes gene_type:complete